MSRFEGEFQKAAIGPGKDVRVSLLSPSHTRIKSVSER